MLISNLFGFPIFMRISFPLTLAVFACISPAYAATAVPFTVNMSENVTVNTTGGTPRIAVNVGGVTRYATYTAGSGTAALTFTYTTQAGEVDLDGVALSSPLDLNGGTITDAAGNALSPLTFTVPSTTGIRVDHPSLLMNFTADADGTFLLNSTAQTTFSSFLTAASGSFARSSVGTYYDSSGNLQTAATDVPRFDYDPVSHAARGLLIEESRTNYVPRSEEIDNASWSKSGGVTGLVANTATSPSGTMTAEVISTTGSAGAYILSPAFAFSAGQTLTKSIYAKAGTSSRIIFEHYDPGNAAVTFDLATQTVTPSAGVTGSIQAVGNGWYRLVATKTFTNSSATASWRVTYIDTYGTAPAGRTIYLWGAQIEIGAFPTSYIPTAATSVTRSPDNFLMPKGTWFNTTAGAWLADFDGGRESSQGYYGRVISYEGSKAALATSLAATSVTTWDGILSMTQASGTDYYTTAGKAGVSYNEITLTRSLSGRGVAPLTGSYTGTYDSTSGTFAFGRNVVTPSNMLNGHIKMIKYYPARPSDAQLQLLTQ